MVPPEAANTPRPDSSECEVKSSTEYREGGPPRPVRILSPGGQGRVRGFGRD